MPLAVFVASWAWLANLTRCHNHHKRARHRELHQMLGAMARNLLHFPPKWRHRSHFSRIDLFLTILSILGPYDEFVRYGLTTSAFGDFDSSKLEVQFFN